MLAFGSRLAIRRWKTTPDSHPSGGSELPQHAPMPLSASGGAPIPASVFLENRMRLYRLAPEHRTWTVIGTVIALVVYAPALVIYALAIGLLHQTNAVAAWIALFQPAVDRLSAYLPVIWKIPLALRAANVGHWTAAVQHVLLIGWLATALIMVLVALDIVVIDRRHWREAGIAGSRKQWREHFVGSLVLWAAAASLLSYGWDDVSKFASVGGLPFLGFLFVVMAFFFTASMLLIVDAPKRFFPRHLQSTIPDRDKLRNLLKRPGAKTPS